MIFKGLKFKLVELAEMFFSHFSRLLSCFPLTTFTLFTLLLYRSHVAAV